MVARRGRGAIAPTHSRPRMGMSGQRHALAALCPRYPMYRRLGGPQSRCEQRGYRKNPLPLPGIAPVSPGRPVRSQTLTHWAIVTVNEFGWKEPHTVSGNGGILLHKWAKLSPWIADHYFAVQIRLRDFIIPDFSFTQNLIYSYH
jgi:hypothetical protein